MNTLLIIGGTGFFGKSILDAFKRDLLNKWKINKIIVMSRNSDNFKLNYPELITQRVEIFTGDITTIDHLPNADYVIHAAASTDASRYKTKNFEEKENIIKGTLNYCRLASEFHKNSRIVFCSSGAVYGYQPKHIKYLEEDREFGNINSLDDVKKSYAYAKRNAEFAIKKLGQSGLNVSIARCFAFVGKCLPRDQHFAIGNFIADSLAGRDIIIKADRKVVRSYMYADDLIKWLMTIAENAKSNCPIYNVGSNQEIEIRELATIMSKICNVGVRSIELNNNSTVDRYIPSIEKAKSELGLSLEYGLEKSIRLSINK
jgi:nucleoside-diphosphate-sugar epimerase